MLFPQLRRNRLAGFQQDVHLSVELAEAALPIVRSKTLDRPIEILAAGIGVGETDDPRAFRPRDRREHSRHVTIIAKQGKHVAWLHQRVRLLANVSVNPPQGRLAEAFRQDAPGIFRNQARL